MNIKSINAIVIFFNVVIIYFSTTFIAIGQNKNIEILTDSILVKFKELNLHTAKMGLQNGCDFKTDIKSQKPGYFIPVNITLPKGGTPEKWFGYGCFSTIVKIDSSLYGKKVAVRGLMRGAMELYINGELAGKAGTVSENPSDEEAICLFGPIEFNLGHHPEQQIGIRYSNHAAKNFYNKYESGLQLYLGLPENVKYAHNYIINRSDSTEKRFNLIFGFMSALGLLHLFLFIFYPSEKANLTCSIFFFCISTIFLSGILFDAYKLPDDYIYSTMVEGIGTTLTSIILFFFLYQLIKWKLNWLPFLFLGLGIVTIILVIINPVANQVFYNVYFLVSVIIGIFILLYARFKQNKKELNIILVFYLVALVLLLPNLLSSTLEWKILWYNNLTLMNLSAIPVAIGYSLFLARGVTVTNKNLKLQLKENERLNSEKLKSETEKKFIVENQKKNLELEVKKRTADLRKSLKDLKSAQTQLIQSEKMASLGELTAGIAHEIQNPLNFVNNFSEVNKELLEEMQEEIDNGDFDEVKAIMEDVVQNLEKINHHGQRADSIVKGMLQHSRTGGKQKEPTDINKLADEYLRLAYHGMRAKDKSFNVEIKSNFDEKLPLVSIIPQDIGRVLLNLLTNAFYAVSERQEELKSHDETDYKPTVTVTTKFFPLPGGDPRDGSIEITVKDNGGGIPKEIVDKIFQPFFTTKPTGEGTGLGLSMSYDIVTKGHGGELKVKSEIDQGSIFIINLPVNTTL